MATIRQRRRVAEPAPGGEAFWRFSLTLYARPGVAEALIALQDRAGCDVNLILFALWAGAVRGVRLDAAALNRADAAIGPLRNDIVEPLRGLRRRLKPEPNPDIQEIRRKILALELAAERQAQRRLAGVLDRAPGSADPDPIAAAEANLALYLGAETQSAEAELLRRELSLLARRG